MNKVETLVRPAKIEQAAALMLTVFEANPNAVMTRREIESLVNVSEFSPSTRQRALNHLTWRGHIRSDSDSWAGGPPTTYWMSADALASAG